MAATVHQLVLHPAITGALRVGSTTVGRDKLYRAIQYAARFLAFYTLRKGYTQATVAQWSALKSTLALSRKLMRIGKPLEHLQAGVKSLDIADPVLKYTALGRQLGYAGYLVNDMLVWAHTAKVHPFTTPTYNKISQRAARFWFTGIAFSIVSSVYRLNDLNRREQQARRVRSAEKETERKAELKAVLAQRAAVRTQLLQDSLDILIPSGTLGYHNLDDGIIGLVGVVTSIMGLRTQINKVLGPTKAA
ncbi:Peroxisomal membrane protein PMP27 [Microbotryomycetes sp. JL221]|nr:Peroxisomal membrane protein PMP27 [Microbotryomycetes sp. JL221]